THCPLPTAHYPLPTSHSLSLLHFRRLVQRRPLVSLFELEPGLGDPKLFAEVSVPFEEERLRAVIGGHHLPPPRFSIQELLRRDSSLTDLIAIDHNRFLQLPVNRRVDNREIAVALHTSDLKPFDRDE